jgi:hypothetical protein
MTKSQKLNCSIIIVTSLLILTYFITQPIAQQKNIIATKSYYLISICFWWWLLSVITLFKEKRCHSQHRLNKDYLIGIIICSIITFLTYISIESGYKVLADEANIMAVAKSFYFDKTGFNDTMGRWYFDSFYPILREFPKRPYLYAYLVSNLHSLLGYSLSNGILLNCFFMGCILFFIYLLILFSSNYKYAIVAVIATSSNPIIATCANSCGLDLCFIFFLLSTIFLAYLILIYKDNNLLLQTFLLTCTLLANTRYEAIVYALAIFIFLLIIKKININNILNNMHVLLCIPLLLLPVFGQIYLSQGKFENGEKNLLSWDNFTIHSKDMFTRLFEMNLEHPFSQALILAGFISYPLCYALVRKKSKLFANKNSRCLFYIFSICLFIQLSLILSHHFGFYTHPTQARLFLFTIISMSTLVVLMLGTYAKQNVNFWILISLACYIYYRPTAGRLVFTNKLISIRETRFIDNTLNKYYNKNILIITKTPGRFTIRNFGAVNFDYFNKNHKYLLNDLNRRLYQKIVLIQDIHYATNKADPSQTITAMKTTTKEELQIDATKFIRISELISKNI